MKLSIVALLVLGVSMAAAHSWSTVPQRRIDSISAGDIQAAPCGQADPGFILERMSKFTVGSTIHHEWANQHTNTGSNRVRLAYAPLDQSGDANAFVNYYDVDGVYRDLMVDVPLPAALTAGRYTIQWEWSNYHSCHDVELFDQPSEATFQISNYNAAAFVTAVASFANVPENQVVIVADTAVLDGITTVVAYIDWDPNYTVSGDVQMTAVFAGLSANDPSLVGTEGGMQVLSASAPGQDAVLTEAGVESALDGNGASTGLATGMIVVIIVGVAILGAGVAGGLYFFEKGRSTNGGSMPSMNSAASPYDNKPTSNAAYGAGASYSEAPYSAPHTAPKPSSGYSQGPPSRAPSGYSQGPPSRAPSGYGGGYGAPAPAPKPSMRPPPVPRQNSYGNYV